MISLFKKNKKISKSKKVQKAKILYLYIIFSSICSLIYFVTAIFLGYPKSYSLFPFYLLLLAFFAYMLFKNWKLLYNYIAHIDRGKLLLCLNETTHFEEDHKRKLIKWVYLSKGRIRTETRDKILQKVYENAESRTNGEEAKHDLSEKELALLKLKPIKIPQQLLDGHNEAFLINALIYSHRNIKVLDQELRDFLKLTEKRMLSFNIQDEMDKMTGKNIKKYQELGEKISNPKTE